jgi:protein-tyrosine-phosphatase
MPLRDDTPDTTPNGPIHVLFLCDGNSARSQIAEAILAKKGGPDFVVASAGANPAASVRREAIEVLRQIGIEWSGHNPKGLASVAGERWDVVITVCDRTREACPTFPHHPITAHWGIPDPVMAEDSTRRRAAFFDTVNLLSWRIDLMLSLGPQGFSRSDFEERVRGIPFQDQRHAAVQRPDGDPA